jgi:hypothetical protein
MDQLRAKEDFYYDEFQETVHEECIRPIRNVDADRRRKKAYGKEKVICKCGLESMRKNLARHRRSHAHVRLLAAQKMSDKSKHGISGREPQEKETNTRRFQEGCEGRNDRSCGRDEEEKEASDESTEQR